MTLDADADADADADVDAANDVDLMERLADAADRLTLPGFQADRIEVEYKDDGSPVTPVDKAVEQSLLAMVGKSRPDDGFLGEEVGPHPGSSGRTWIVDGIDGTRQFVKRRLNWSTLIALTIDGSAVAGAVTSPALGRRWMTTADGGAVVAEAGAQVDLAVSTTDELVAGRIALWPGDAWVGEMLAERHPALLELVGEPRTSAQLTDEWLPHGAVPVADGRIDAMIAFSGSAWDHAGPSGVIRGAGGRFSAVDGSAALDTRTAVYSNGRVHDRLIDLLGR